MKPRCQGPVQRFNVVWRNVYPKPIGVADRSDERLHLGVVQDRRRPGSRYDPFRQYVHAAIPVDVESSHTRQVQLSRAGARDNLRLVLPVRGQRRLPDHLLKVGMRDEQWRRTIICEEADEGVVPIELSQIHLAQPEERCAALVQLVEYRR